MQLSITATGGGLTYQWMADGTAISHVFVYSKTADALPDAGTYTVIISNLTGAIPAVMPRLPSRRAVVSPTVTVTVSSSNGGGGGGAEP